MFLMSEFPPVYLTPYPTPLKPKTHLFQKSARRRSEESACRGGATLAFRVWGSVFGVQGSGCRVQGSGFGVYECFWGGGAALAFGVWGSVFGVQGSGCRVEG